jgi:ATP-binding cassette subfamily C protein
LTAIVTITLFALVAILLHKLLHKEAKQLGEVEAAYNIRTNEAILDSLSLFRTIIVGNRQKYFVSKLRDSRLAHAEVNARISFLPSITKYVSESVLLIATVTVAAIQFLLQDAVQAAASFGIFLAAGSRIAPAVMRLQQNVLIIKGNLGNSLKP